MQDLDLTYPFLPKWCTLNIEDSYTSRRIISFYPMVSIIAIEPSIKIITFFI
jgi:hypothetical protein